MLEYCRAVVTQSALINFKKAQFSNTSVCEICMTSILSFITYSKCNNNVSIDEWCQGKRCGCAFYGPSQVFVVNPSQ